MRIHYDKSAFRLPRPDDTFLAFGGEKDETPDLDEVVYAIGQQVRTCRWT